VTAQPIHHGETGVQLNKRPEASRFYARNGEVFMVGEQGGFCLSHAETLRCIAHWRSEDTDREPWAQRMTEQMADELEVAMTQAETQRKQAA
jgi:hypothetical protein